MIRMFYVVLNELFWLMLLVKKFFVYNVELFIQLMNELNTVFLFAMSSNFFFADKKIM